MKVYRLVMGGKRPRNVLAVEADGPLTEEQSREVSEAIAAGRVHHVDLRVLAGAEADKAIADAVTIKAAEIGNETDARWSRAS